MSTISAAQRRRALLGAHRAADRAGLPWLAATTRGVASAVLLGLVRDELPPFAFGLFAVALSMAWVGFALVGEWAHLLRADDDEDWLAALPATAFDRRLARTLHVVELVAMLALPSVLVAALLVPSVSAVERVVFGAALFGSTFATAGALAFAVLLFAGRFEGLWMALQALAIGVFLWGLLEILGALDQLALVPEIGDSVAPFLWFVPPAWFAAPLGSGDVAAWRWLLPLAPTLVGLVLLATLPAPRVRASVGRGWLDVVLTPVRAFAIRVWVRVPERPSFELICDALPREREVVLRSYPLVALPLVFLVLAVGGAEDARTRADFLAVVQFGAVLYLPVLVTQVPVSRSWRAVWLLESSPASNADVQLGAFKAIVVRFVVPLYVLFAVLTCSLRGPEAVLRLTLPAFVFAVLAVAQVWPACVDRTPLSTSPDEFAPPTAWYANMLGWSMVLTVLAILVERKVELPFGTLALVVAIVVLEQIVERRLRARLAAESQTRLA